MAFADEVARKTAAETEKATQRQRDMEHRDGAGHSGDTSRQSDQVH